jgi:hypothetical protein
MSEVFITAIFPIVSQAWKAVSIIGLSCIRINNLLEVLWFEIVTGMLCTPFASSSLFLFKTMFLSLR